MSISLFANRKAASAFSGAIILGVALFADTLSTVTVPTGKVSQHGEPSSDIAVPSTNSREAQPFLNEQPAIADSSSDSELKDDTSGFDSYPQPIQNAQANGSRSPRSSNLPLANLPEGEGLVPVKIDPRLSREEALRPTP